MLEVRNALLNSGTNLWQPRAMNAQALGQALGKAGDDEVMRALEQLLVARHQVGVGERVESCHASSVASGGQRSLLLRAPFLVMRMTCNTS